MSRRKFTTKQRPQRESAGGGGAGGGRQMLHALLRISVEARRYGSLPDVSLLTLRNLHVPSERSTRVWTTMSLGLEVVGLSSSVRADKLRLVTRGPGRIGSQQQTYSRIALPLTQDILADTGCTAVFDRFIIQCTMDMLCTGASSIQHRPCHCIASLCPTFFVGGVGGW